MNPVKPLQVKRTEGTKLSRAFNNVAVAVLCSYLTASVVSAIGCYLAARNATHSLLGLAELTLNSTLDPQPSARIADESLNSTLLREAVPAIDIGFNSPFGIRGCLLDEHGSAAGCIRNGSLTGSDRRSDTVVPHFASGLIPHRLQIFLLDQSSPQLSVSPSPMDMSPRSTLFLWSAAGLLLVVLSLRLERRLDAIGDALNRFNSGDTDFRLPVSGNDLVSTVSESFNRLADTLSSHKSHARLLAAHTRTMFLNIAHDLRTPLTSMLGFVETLRTANVAMSIDDERRFFDAIERSMNQQLHLVNDLTQLSIQSGGVPSLTISRVDARRLLEQAAEQIAPSAARRNITVTLELSPHPIQLQCDRSLLERALGNLLSNAVRYTPAGGTIALSVTGNGNIARVQVADTGIGIASHELPYIFEQFYRANASRPEDPGGTGIGLAIVKRIVDAHQGTIEVTSTVDEGSTFTLVLPIKPPLTRIDRSNRAASLALPAANPSPEQSTAALIPGRTSAGADGSPPAPARGSAATMSNDLTSLLSVHGLGFLAAAVAISAPWGVPLLVIGLFCLSCVLIPSSVPLLGPLLAPVRHIAAAPLPVLPLGALWSLVPLATLGSYNQSTLLLIGTFTALVSSIALSVLQPCCRMRYIVPVILASAATALGADASAAFMLGCVAGIAAGAAAVMLAGKARHMDPWSMLGMTIACTIALVLPLQSFGIRARPSELAAILYPAREPVGKASGIADRMFTDRAQLSSRATFEAGEDRHSPESPRESSPLSSDRSRAAFLAHSEPVVAKASAISLILSILLGLAVAGLIIRRPSNRLRALASRFDNKPLGSSAVSHERSATCAPSIDSLENGFALMAKTIIEAEQDIAAQRQEQAVMLARIAAEVRGPLDRVRPHLAVLRAQLLGSRETWSDSLRVVHRQMIRQKRLVDDLFDMSKMELSRRPLHIEPFECSELLWDAAADYRSELQIFGIELQIDFPQRAFPLVSGDMDLTIRSLYAIFENILSSGVRESTARIFAETSAESMRYSIEIRYLSEKQHVLNARLGSVENDLGLDIARRALLEAQGSLSITHAADMVRFTIMLPRAAADGIRDDDTIRQIPASPDPTH